MNANNSSQLFGTWILPIINKKLQIFLTSILHGRNSYTKQMNSQSQLKFKCSRKERNLSIKNFPQVFYKCSVQITCIYKQLSNYIQPLFSFYMHLLAIRQLTVTMIKHSRRPIGTTMAQDLYPNILYHQTCSNLPLLE